MDSIGKISIDINSVLQTSLARQISLVDDDDVTGDNAHDIERLKSIIKQKDEYIESLLKQFQASSLPTPPLLQRAKSDPKPSAK